jgi:hypothetical protein
MANGPSVEGSEFDRSHVAEIVAECVAGIGSSGSVAENIGVAVKLDPELSEVTGKGLDGSSREHAANGNSGLAALGKERLAGRCNHHL